MNICLPKLYVIFKKETVPYLKDPPPNTHTNIKLFTPLPAIFVWCSRFIKDARMALLLRQAEAADS